MSLETVDFDGLLVKLKSVFLVAEESFDVLALVALKLDYLAHVGVIDNGAIAGSSQC